MRNRVCACLIISLLLAACSGGQDNSQLGAITGNVEKYQPYELTADQTSLYQKGLKEILPTTGPVNFNAVNTIKFSNQPGLHICGFVAFKATSGEQTEQPFYVELRIEQDDGASKTIIHRGQIGSDPAKLSKVNFVCRHHQSV